MKQIRFNLNKGTHGGRRDGSGRKRIHSRGVSHRVREKVNYRVPLHINFKYRTYIKNKSCLKLLKRAIMNARSHGLRINHFSMQSNHIHLIVEAESNEILTTGMRSLTVTFAKGLKQGRVQLERYHLQILRSIQQTKHALYYVLFNKQKHEKGTCSTIDEFCSVWGIKDAISIYARSNRMTLKLGEMGYWRADCPVSYFLKRALLIEQIT